MSARGFGGSVRTAAGTPPAAAPGVTGAQNGVGMNGTLVELGFPLIRDTTIDLAGNDFIFDEASLGSIFFVDQALQSVGLGPDGTGGTGLISKILFEPARITMDMNIYQVMMVDDTTTLFEFGDTLSALNGMLLHINDSARSAELGNLGISGNGTRLLVHDGDQVIRGYITALDTMLNLDFPNSIYQMGDIDGIGFNSYLQIDDFARSYTYFVGLDRFLFLDPFNSLFQIGDIDTAGNGTMISIDDALQQIFLVDGSLAGASNGDVWTLIDQTTGEGGWAAGGGGGSDLLIAAYQALGSTIKAMPVGFTQANMTAAAGSGLGDGNLRLMAVYLSSAQTITGVKWFQVIQGSYTADNYNGIGLYSYDGAGNLTLVASSTDNGNIWKGAGNSFQTTPFSATYAAAAGIYFVALLYNSSAEVTAPTARSFAANQQPGAIMDFTNSAFIGGFIAAQAALPTPQVTSGVTAVLTNFFVALY